MSHVVVLNQHTNNFGDDAAGSALIGACTDLLGATAIDIYYIWHKAGGQVPGPDDVCRHHKPSLLSGSRDNRVRMMLAAMRGMVSTRLLPRELRRLVESCRQADVVYVSPAGSNIGIYKDWMYLLTLLVVVNAGVRPIFCQNTIAASNSRAFNRVARRVLRKSQLYVRELASQDYLTSIGLQSSLGVDTALLLPPSDHAGGSSGYIAVVPTQLGNWHRDHRDFDDHKMLTETLASGLAAGSRRVVLVPHLHGPEAETELFDTLSSAIREHALEVEIASVKSLDDYRDTLAGAAAVVSMRYHGLILSAMAGVPCVALSYENKMLEAAAYLGLTEFTLDVRTASAADIRQALMAVLDPPESLALQMAAKLETSRSVAKGPLLEAAARLVRISPSARA